MTVFSKEVVFMFDTTIWLSLLYICATVILWIAAGSIGLKLYANKEDEKNLWPL